MPNLYMARQPILDASGRLYGFELLYRAHLSASSSDFTDGKQATASVLVNTLNLAGTEETLGAEYAFINVDRDFLLDDSIFSIPKEKFILEIIETVPVDETVLERIKMLKMEGFRFALDDVDLSDECLLNFGTLISLIDIVKLDLPHLDESRLEPFIARCRRGRIKLLAEKVETFAQYEHYKSLGCNYFQGYFFAKPDIIENKKLEPERFILLELIGQLQGELDIQKTVKIFEQNAALTFQLLRYINSAFFSLRRPVKSIRQAVLFLGQTQLRNWLLLLAYAHPDQEKKGYQDTLLYLTHTRAAMMQQFCRLLHQNLCDHEMLDKATFIGLLSLAEPLFDTSMDLILGALNLDEEIVASLTRYEGSAGHLLELVLAVEQDDRESVDALLAPFAVDTAALNEAIQQAYAAAGEHFSIISTAGEDE